ncbi:hypothetical protein LZ30DRAFT_179823 [Colletotrichum cereale]|nr:hypothetical protein LZ30DRAFT_179823 [Colletotrichum cereale]
MRWPLLGSPVLRYTLQRRCKAPPISFDRSNAAYRSNCWVAGRPPDAALEISMRAASGSLSWQSDHDFNPGFGNLRLFLLSHKADNKALIKFSACRPPPSPTHPPQRTITATLRSSCNTPQSFSHQRRHIQGIVHSSPGSCNASFRQFSPRYRLHLAGRSSPQTLLHLRY